MINPIGLTDSERKLLSEIRAGHNPICLHVLGQSLADALTSIIRKMDNLEATLVCQNTFAIKK